MKDILYFFHLSRPLNVVITFVAYFLASFLAWEKQLTFLELEEFWWGAGILSLISATGYWVNDAFDFKIDRVNRPRRVIVNAHLSVKKVLTVYFLLLVGLLTASFFLQSLPLFGLNCTAAALLFLYAAYLKRTTVIGNLVIAALTALVIYYAALLFDLRLSLIWMIVFAFEVTFLREVVKDIEDIEGDLQFKLQTLPIRVGISVTKQVLYFAIAIFLLSCWGPFLHEYWIYQQANWRYLGVSIVLVQLPTIYLWRTLKQANTEKDFGKLSLYLKLLIFLGMVSLLCLQ